MSMPASQLTCATSLAELLHGIADAPAIDVTGIESDSRRLAAGDLFIAMRGESAHALDYLDAGVAQQLAAIAWDGDDSAELPAGVPAVVIPELKAQVGEIANRFFDWPSRAVAVDGVTGTNGKTTVAWLLAQCWQRLGVASGYVGTLGAGLDEVTDSGGLTTPDCITLHRRLAAFRDAGARRATLEVSSHALAQGRLDGVRIETAMFTNLSRDHLDYHGSMAAYGDTKAQLFTGFSPTHSVICIDTAFGRELAERCGDTAIRVSSVAGAVPDGRHVAVGSCMPGPHGSRLQVQTSWGDGEVVLPLYGAFNVANALVVLASLLAADVEFDDAFSLLAELKAPPGRLQRVIASDALPAVFVDYAHTPAALEAVLTALRAHSPARLWCVFGCGGDRDRGKRPQMGEVVTRCADTAVLTSDNPRTEDPLAIMRDVQQGMHPAVTAIEDRAAAIAWAIDHAAPDDIVLIAGKGHEDYQVLGTQRVPFSDYQVAARNLRMREQGA